MPTPTPTPTATPIGNGVFTFNPPSPLFFASGSGGTATVTVSEGNYAGGFSITSCVGGQGCGPDQQPGGFSCSETAFGGGGLSVLEIDPATTPFSTQFSVSSIAPQSGITCTFTFTDQQGHSADYTVQ